MRVGQTIDLNSTDLNGLDCKPSETFAEASFCTRKRNINNPRGAFVETTSILVSDERKALYINQSLDPAFWNNGEVDSEIDRISRKHKLSAVTKSLPSTNGLPEGTIATWGSIILEPLPDSARQVLADGQSPKIGILLDFQNDLTLSAKRRLPIFRVRGSGYVWVATVSSDGKGKLRFLTIDTYQLALKDAPRAASTSSATIIPAPASSPTDGDTTQNKPAAIPNEPTDSKEKTKYVQRATIDTPRITDETSADYTIDVQQSIRQRNVVIGHIASSDQICGRLSHPFLLNSLKSIRQYVGTVNGGLKDDGTASQWFKQRLGTGKGWSDASMIWETSKISTSVIDKNLTDCLKKIASENFERYRVIHSLFLQYPDDMGQCGVERLAFGEGDVRARFNPNSNKRVTTSCFETTRQSSTASSDYLSREMALVLTTVQEAGEIFSSILDQQQKAFNAATQREREQQEQTNSEETASIRNIQKQIEELKHAIEAKSLTVSGAGQPSVARPITSWFSTGENEATCDSEQTKRYIYNEFGCSIVGCKNGNTIFDLINKYSDLATIRADEDVSNKKIEGATAKARNGVSYIYKLNLLYRTKAFIAFSDTFSITKHHATAFDASISRFTCEASISTNAENLTDLMYFLQLSGAVADLHSPYNLTSVMIAEGKPIRDLSVMLNSQRALFGLAAQSFTKVNELKYSVQRTKDGILVQLTQKAANTPP
jgi:hypothetical protein